MIQLSAELNPRQVADINKRCDGIISPAKRDAAIKRAAKRAADAAKTETKRQLTALYTVPSGEVAQTISTRMNKGAGAVMKISAGVNSLPVFKGVKPKAPVKKPVGVAVAVKQSGGSMLKGAFTAQMASGHIGVFERTKGKMKNPYQRKGKSGGGKRQNATYRGQPVRSHGRDAIKEDFGPATSGMFKANPDVHEPVVKKAGETFSKRAEYEISRLLEGK